MRRATETEWERAVDTVVIGSGGSGMLATLAASDAGVETLVLEKAPALGGATAVSGGAMSLPNSEPLLDEIELRWDLPLEVVAEFVVAIPLQLVEVVGF